MRLEQLALSRQFAGRCSRGRLGMSPTRFFVSQFVQEALSSNFHFVEPLVRIRKARSQSIYRLGVFIFRRCEPVLESVDLALKRLAAFFELLVSRTGRPAILHLQLRQQRLQRVTVGIGRADLASLLGQLVERCSGAKLWVIGRARC